MSPSTDNNHGFPPVSVIILTFNGGEYIAQLLQSLERQTYPNDLVEIIVVDNASRDDTVDIIKKNYPSVKVVINKINMGFAAGNNEGLRFASHDLLVFLNQDTVCHSEFLISLVDVMIQDETLAACNPNIITQDPANFSTHERMPHPKVLHVCDLSPFGYGKNRMIHGQALYYPKLLSGCAFIIRRDLISKLGYLFDDQLWMYAEDTDLSLRIRNLGQKTGALRRSVIFHLHNQNMAVGKTRLLLAAQAIRNRIHVFYKNMGSLEFLIYLPLMLLGGSFKIFEFPLTTFRKYLYFLPFSLFSMMCMGRAILGLPQFASLRRQIISRRQGTDFSILKWVLRR